MRRRENNKHEEELRKRRDGKRMKMVDMLRGHNLTGPRGLPYTYAECDDGWVDLVDSLIIDLKAMGWKGQVHQIKEKFGGLRFYCSGDGVVGSRGTEFWDRIQKAESDSLKICESCGKPGYPRVGGWIKTLCDEHGAGRDRWDYG